ncbi:MAG: ABC transporter transmembrane domain-containing protein, partial [Pseudomonadota bacterium]
MSQTNQPANTDVKPAADADIASDVQQKEADSAKGEQKMSRKSWPLVKRLVDLYMRPYFGTLGLASIFMVMAAIMTGAMAKLMEPIVDDVFSAGDRSMLYPVAGAVLAAFVIRGLSTYCHNVLMNRVGQGVVADIQRQLASHLIRADLAYLQTRSSGQLISNMISDVNVMRTAMAECLLGFVRGSLTLAILIGVMFWQDWHLASVCFVVLPAGAILVAKLGKRLRSVSIKTQTELGEFSAQLNQTFQSIRQVKAYGMEGHEESRLNQVIARLYDLAHRGFRVAAFATPISEILSGVAIVTVIIYGGMRVIDGASTAGEVFSFITAFLMAYEPMKKLAKLNGTLQMGL